jgi:hypothetical protein
MGEGRKNMNELHEKMRLTPELYKEAILRQVAILRALANSEKKIAAGRRNIRVARIMRMAKVLRRRGIKI